MKNKQYVGIMCRNEVQYITRVDRVSREAWWVDGEPAKAMTQKQAEDVYNGLRANGYMAVIMVLPEYETPHNPEPEREESGVYGDGQ